MAHGVLQDLVQTKGLEDVIVEVDSCGSKSTREIWRMHT